MKHHMELLSEAYDEVLKNRPSMSNVPDPQNNNPENPISVTIEEIIVHMYTRQSDPERPEEYDSGGAIGDVITNFSRIVHSISNKRDRQRVVEEEIGSDPWSWSNIPNFQEMADSGQLNVDVVYPDGQVVSAPLKY